MNKQYDCIIVGAGSIGMAAGYYLAKQGVQTLLIDAQDPPHQMGSHHGQTRIIRHAYGEGKGYVPLALRAQELWIQLEKEAEETLFSQTGVLTIGQRDASFIQEMITSSKEYSLPIEMLESEEVEERWPGIVMPAGYVACFEPTSGVIFSEKAIRAYRNLALSHGANLLPYTQVERLVIEPSSITIQTNNGTYYGEKAIVTAGAWSKQLLATVGLTLPLQPTRKAIGWFQAEKRLFAAQRFPAFVFNFPDETYYGFPCFDEQGLKIGCHHGGQRVQPDQVDRHFGADKEDEGKLRRFLETYMPQAAGKLTKGGICLYNMTPDEHFIIDLHPEHNHVIIATGFSGHGFKFASSIGECLSEIISRGNSSLDLSLFSLKRFNG